MHTRHESAIALLGAYERDNFGDILFLQLTKEHLRNQNTLTTAPLGAHGNFRPLDEAVHSLRHVASQHSLSAVWMVGGETGGTSMADAYRMAAPPATYAKHAETSRDARIAQLRELSGRSFYSSPYLPRMSGSPSTMQSHFIINSAGLSGISGLFGHRRDEAWTAVREASFVSVRDKSSSDILSRANIPHTLAPDLVHSLRATRPHWVRRNTARAPYALVQVKGAVLREYGTEALAKTLFQARSLRDYDLQLFVAGSAQGHDSRDLYREVVVAGARINPKRKIGIIDNISAIKKAELIAGAGLWIGTSLHGLIISSAFEVPRVALELDKLVRYASTWKEPMPVGVQLASLDEAVMDALSTNEVAGRSDQMARTASASIEQARETLDSRTAPHDIEKRQQNERLAAHRSRSLVRSILTEGADHAKRWRRR